MTAFPFRLDDLDDDFAFVPTSWDLAVALGIGLDPDADAAALDLLADAMLVGLCDGPELEGLTSEALHALWDGELTRLVREGLERLAARDEWREGAGQALAALAEPADSEVCREVVRRLAMQLSQVGTPVMFCLHCLDEFVQAAPAAARRAIVVESALAARRSFAFTPDELRAAVSSAGLERLGTPARRGALRERLGRLASLGRTSLPALAPELRRLADEPLPESAAADDVWAVVARRLLMEVADPASN